MPKYRATVTVTVTYHGVVELEAEDKQAFEDQIVDDEYCVTRLPPDTWSGFIEDIECLDEDPGGGEDT